LEKVLSAEAGFVPEKVFEAAKAALWAGRTPAGAERKPRRAAKGLNDLFMSGLLSDFSQSVSSDCVFLS
jgi:hypothetical protein